MAIDIGAAKVLTVEVKAKSAAKKGNQFALLITSSIDGYSGHADTVQAVTKRK